MDLWTRPEKAGLGIGLISGKWPRVIIEPEAAARMEALVQCCNIEISWMTAVDREDNDFLVSNVIVPPQVCSSGGTVFREANMMAMFIGNDGKIPNDVLPMINRLRGWGHSHHNMAVFASATDDNQADAFVSQMDDYFVRLICNKAGEINVTLYLLDRGLVLYHPKIICRKFPKAERAEIFAKEMYPFDDWAMEAIDKNVHRAYQRLHDDDDEPDVIDIELGRKADKSDGFPYYYGDYGDF